MLDALDSIASKSSFSKASQVPQPTWVGEPLFHVKFHYITFCATFDNISPLCVTFDNISFCVKFDYISLCAHLIAFLSMLHLIIYLFVHIDFFLY